MSLWIHCSFRDCHRKRLYETIDGTHGGWESEGWLFLRKETRSIGELTSTAYHLCRTHKDLLIEEEHECPT